MHTSVVKVTEPDANAPTLSSTDDLHNQCVIWGWLVDDMGTRCVKEAQPTRALFLLVSYVSLLLPV